MITSPLLNTYKLTIEKNEHLKPRYKHNTNAKPKELKKKQSMRRVYSTKSIHFAQKTPWNFVNPSQSSQTERQHLFGTEILKRTIEEKGVIVLKDFTCSKRKPILQKESDRIFLEKISIPFNNVYKTKEKQRPMTSYKSPVFQRVGDQIAKHKASLAECNAKKINFKHSNCNLEFLKLINPHMIKIKSSQLLYYQLRKEKPFNGTRAKVSSSFFK